MKILFIVYHDLDTNGRSQQMMRCAEMIGDATLVSYHMPIQWKTGRNSKVIVSGNGKRRYVSFLLTARKALRRILPDIVILHDNYCAPLLPYIEKLSHKPFVVYDSSELYIDKKTGGFYDNVAYLIQKQENKYISKANFIIAANLERAKIMHDYFKLKERPYVFDNVRKITEEPDLIACNEQFGKFFAKERFVILYAGGISSARLTYDLIKTVKKMGEKYFLLLSGNKKAGEEQLYEEALHETDCENVFYLGYIKRSEMKYLFNKVDISVAMFLQDTINNINCASGKFFESIFEGCPVLASTNPPLKRLCEDYQIGVSTDDFESGILKLQENLEFYKSKVAEFASSVDIEQNIVRLSEEILGRLK